MIQAMAATVQYTMAGAPRTARITIDEFLPFAGARTSILVGRESCAVFDRQPFSCLGENHLIALLLKYLPSLSIVFHSLSAQCHGTPHPPRALLLVAHLPEVVVPEAAVSAYRWAKLPEGSATFSGP